MGMKRKRKRKGKSKRKRKRRGAEYLYDNRAHVIGIIWSFNPLFLETTKNVGTEGEHTKLHEIPNPTV